MRTRGTRGTHEEFIKALDDANYIKSAQCGMERLDAHCSLAARLVAHASLFEAKWLPEAGVVLRERTLEAPEERQGARIPT